MGYLPAVAEHLYVRDTVFYICIAGDLEAERCIEAGQVLLGADVDVVVTKQFAGAADGLLHQHFSDAVAARQW